VIKAGLTSQHRRQLLNAMLGLGRTLSERLGAL
jgi:hypothetical protein